MLKVPGKVAEDVGDVVVPVVDDEWYWCWGRVEYAVDEMVAALPNDPKCMPPPTLLSACCTECEGCSRYGVVYAVEVVPLRTSPEPKPPALALSDEYGPDDTGSAGAAAAETVGSDDDEVDDDVAVVDITCCVAATPTLAPATVGVR